jgi:hypothetical protein
MARYAPGAYTSPICLLEPATNAPLAILNGSCLRWEVVVAIMGDQGMGKVFVDRDS